MFKRFWRCVEESGEELAKRTLFKLSWLSVGFGATSTGWGQFHGDGMRVFWHRSSLDRLKNRGGSAQGGGGGSGKIGYFIVLWSILFWVMDVCGSFAGVS